MREVLHGGNVKGGVLRAHVDWFRLNLPNRHVDALRALVSPETARVLTAPILPTNWYPFRSVVETDRAIAVLRGGMEQETAVELGRFSARVNLMTSYRAFTRERPHEFFRESARLHRQFEDFGRATYEQTGPTSCRLSIEDCACYAKTYCWSALGYFEEATALQGGHGPQVAEKECLCEGGGACRFDIRWS